MNKIQTSTTLIHLLFLLLFVNSYSQSPVNNTRITGPSENNIDVKIFRAFNNTDSKFLNSMVNISNESIIPVSIAAPLGLYVSSRINKNHYDESSAVLLGISEVTNEVVTQILKYSVRRDRPFKSLKNVRISEKDKKSVKTSYSFPSGHASGSVVIATSLTLRYHDKPLLIAGLYTYATIISLGRIYCGVHYPSDVFAGMLIGAGSAALVYSLRKPIIEAKNKFFNQSERAENSGSNINTPVFLISIAAADLINHYLSNSNNKILKKSKINFSSTSDSFVNYTFTF